MGKKSNSTGPYATSKVPVPKPTAEIDPSNIIVRLKGLTDVEKKIVRDEHNVTDYKTCSCGDKDLELWGLNPIGLSAEAAVQNLRNKRAEGDTNFFFPIPKPESFSQSDCYFSKDICLSDDNDPCVNIVVMDSGINTNYFNDAPFLYDTSGLGGCAGNFGWNFIGEGSSDVSDDHGHGTYVTKIITDMLKAKEVRHRILPLKVLDSEGNGSFWDVLCALSYLQKIQNEGANIHLVNLSLGATMEKELFKFSDYFNIIVKELMKEVLVVTSAGNESLDTDLGSLRHFSSSYDAENILAVGGHQEIDGELRMHPRSNYGVQSIDLAAPYKIEVAGLPVGVLEGTSFSTAYVTALAAEFYMNNGKPKLPALRDEFLKSDDIKPNLVDDKIAGNRAVVG